VALAEPPSLLAEVGSTLGLTLPPGRRRHPVRPVWASGAAV